LLRLCSDPNLQPKQLFFFLVSKRPHAGSFSLVRVILKIYRSFGRVDASNVNNEV
jgi:hypothetical protein